LKRCTYYAATVEGKTTDEWQTRPLNDPQQNSHDDADFVTMGTGDEAELRRLLGLTLAVL
jgi:hypothetical protein